MEEPLKLAAIHDGEGWILEVQNQNGDHVGYLTRPWRGEEKTSQELKAYGFEIQ